MYSTASTSVECPTDYASAEGDVLGGGLVGGLQENTIDDCTKECNDRSDCYSFLYSPGTKHCKLMKERVPEGGTTTPTPDYVFCRRNIVRKYNKVLLPRIKMKRIVIDFF